MKPFAVWAASVVVAFGALAGVTTATRGTEQVFVVVDVSFPMAGLMTRVPAELDRIDDREYSEFALATIREPIHGFQSELVWAPKDAFAPCSIDDFTDYPDASSADERILITSAGSCLASELDGWTIIEVDD